MFDDLFTDDSGTENVAAEPSANAAVNVDRRRADNPHNRQGQCHSDASKQKLRLNHALWQIDKLKDRQTKSEKSQFVSFSEHVARTVFGKQSPDTQKIVLLKNGGIAPIPMKKMPSDQEHIRIIVSMLSSVLCMGKLPESQK